jgi:VCBS repeat-containing protein
VPDSTGKWTFNNQANNLIDGKYTIKATIEDKAGNVLNVNAHKEQELIVDSNPNINQPSIDDPNAGASISISTIDDGLIDTTKLNGSKDTGTDKTDYVTNDKTLTFKGVMSGFVQNGDVVHLKVVQVVNGGEVVVLDKYVTPEVNGNWSFNNQAAELASGNYLIKATLEDKAGNPIKTAVERQLVIEDVAPNTNATLAISSITVDTGSSATDFITSDNKLTVMGSTAGLQPNSDAKIFVQIMNGAVVVKSGYAILTNPSTVNSPWSFVVDPDIGSTLLADGNYTIRAVYTTVAGTEISTPATHDLVVANTLPKLALHEDTAAVTENQILTGLNVLANDGDSSAASIAVTKVEKGALTQLTTAASSVAGSTGTPLKGLFGQLELFADGHYVYTADGSLKAGVQGVDTFTYEAQAVGSSPARAALTTLTINVTGVDDAASIDITGGNLRFIQDGTVSDASSPTAFIKVVDKDAGDSVLKGISTTAGPNSPLTGEYGTLVITTLSTIPGEYAWNYTKNDTATHKANVVQHDLFTFESNDGTAITTLDFKLKQTSGPVTKHEAYGRTSTVDTLDFKDIEQQLVIDFTQPTASTSDTLLKATSVEKIDITGAQSNSGTYHNTIKLDLSSLLQTDTSGGIHRLYIKGDTGDTVQFKLGSTSTTIPDGDAILRVVDGTSYTVYHINNDELLVQSTMAKITGYN